MLFCGFHTGMRKLEIVEAVPEWFNLSTRTVEIRATSTFRLNDRDARTVPLTDQFADFLKSYDLRSPYVLHPGIAHGKHRYRFDFRRSFSDYMKAQGVAWIGPHVMRNSFASICATGGVDYTRKAFIIEPRSSASAARPRTSCLIWSCSLNGLGPEKSPCQSRLPSGLKKFRKHIGNMPVSSRMGSIVIEISR